VKIIRTWLIHTVSLCCWLVV